MPETVTGLTAARMLEIEAQSVVNANLINGQLVFTRHDESEINAGYVVSVIVCTSTTRPSAPTEGLFIYETDTDRVFSYSGTAWVYRGGTIICTSTTRPSAPFDGLTIYETNTARTLIYSSVVSGWVPPWNTAWGRIGIQEVSGTAFDATSPTQLTLSGVQILGNRRYKAILGARYRCANDNTVVEWQIKMSSGGAYSTIRSVQHTAAFGVVTLMPESVQWEEYFAGSAGTYSFQIVGTRVSAAASTTTPSYVSVAIEDIGPTAAPY